MTDALKTHSLVGVAGLPVKPGMPLIDTDGRIFSMIGFIAATDVVLVRPVGETRSFETFAPVHFGLEIVADQPAQDDDEDEDDGPVMVDRAREAKTCKFTFDGAWD